MADHSLTDAAHDLLGHVQRFQGQHATKVRPDTRMRLGLLAESLLLEMSGKPATPTDPCTCTICCPECVG